MEELLRFVCEALEYRGIDYMLSGSLALNAYSVSRVTRDIDIVIELRSDNFETFAAIFEERNCYFHRESAEIEVARGGMFNVIDWTLGGKIDFIIRKEDTFQLTEFNRRVRLPILPDFECWVISAEDLVLAKLIWIQDVYSERQLEDVKNIIRDYKLLDRNYIKSWVTQMKLKDFNVLYE